MKILLIGLLLLLTGCAVCPQQNPYGADEYNWYAPIYYIKKDKATGKYIQINWDGPKISGTDLKLPYPHDGYLYQKTTLGGDAGGFEYYRIKRAAVKQ